MDRANYKLFDENLVKNIMITSGVSLFEFIKTNKDADIKEVCSFIDGNSEMFINETIENMKNMGSDIPDDFKFDNDDADDRAW